MILSIDQAWPLRLAARWSRWAVRSGVWCCCSRSTRARIPSSTCFWRAFGATQSATRLRFWGCGKLKKNSVELLSRPLNIIIENAQCYHSIKFSPLTWGRTLTFHYTIRFIKSSWIVWVSLILDQIQTVMCKNVKIFRVFN